MALLLGVAVLVLLVWAAKSFAKSDPKQATQLMRSLGGAAVLLFAAFLLIRGEIGPAVTVGVLGLGLLGWVAVWPINLFGPRLQTATGQVSRVRTAFLEMELDHDAGRMRGRILAGPHQGASLDSLDVTTLIGLLGVIDAGSRDLLAAYLDRRQPGWRDDAQGDAAARRGRASARGGKMTEEEAYQILGLQPGASAQDIARAHRSLIKKLHPDQGGSNYLAARVNEAKDVLLRRHR
jgi:DnaJ-domain-containing protein 1